MSGLLRPRSGSYVRLRQAVVGSAAYPLLVWPRNTLLAGRHSLTGSRRGRRVHAFCVGTAKSGTHSIARMFERSLSSAHEPDAVSLMRLLDDETPHVVDSSRVERTLRRRDRMLALELEASHLLGPFVGVLVRSFPEARFVLPIRDCRSWLRSMINQQLRKRSSPKDVKWQRVWDVYFQADRLEHPPEEAALRRRGLHTLDGYLAYWRALNERVLETVPEERLFVLRTGDIKPRARELAEFLGLPATSVDAFSGHAYRARGEFRVLEELDPEYLRAKFRVHCGELMRRFYPALTLLGDPAASGLLGG